MNIADLYAEDRRIATTAIEKNMVWRMYAFACFEEMAEPRRHLGGDSMKLRRADGDDDLPVRFKPYWRAISDDDLEELREALIRARYV